MSTPNTCVPLFGAWPGEKEPCRGMAFLAGPSRCQPFRPSVAPGSQHSTRRQTRNASRPNCGANVRLDQCPVNGCWGLIHCSHVRLIANTRKIAAKRDSTPENDAQGLRMVMPCITEAALPDVTLAMDNFSLTSSTDRRAISVMLSSSTSPVSGSRMTSTSPTVKS